MNELDQPVIERMLAAIGNQPLAVRRIGECGMQHNAKQHQHTAGTIQISEARASAG